MKSNLYSLASPIYRQTIENQGCTINMSSHSPESGYMVAIKGKELKIPVLEFNAGHIDGYIRANLDLLYNRSYFIGTWLHGEEIFVDVSFNCQDLEAAKEIAKMNGQIAIWDVLNNKEIEIQTTNN